MCLQPTAFGSRCSESLFVPPCFSGSVQTNIRDRLFSLILHSSRTHESRDSPNATDQSSTGSSYGRSFAVGVGAIAKRQQRFICQSNALPTERRGRGLVCKDAGTIEVRGGAILAAIRIMRFVEANASQISVSFLFAMSQIFCWGDVARGPLCAHSHGFRAATSADGAYRRSVSFFFEISCLGTC